MVHFVVSLHFIHVTSLKTIFILWTSEHLTDKWIIYIVPG